MERPCFKIWGKIMSSNVQSCDFGVNRKKRHSNLNADKCIRISWNKKICPKSIANNWKGDRSTKPSITVPFIYVVCEKFRLLQEFVHFLCSPLITNTQQFQQTELNFKLYLTDCFNKFKRIWQIRNKGLIFPFQSFYLSLSLHHSRIFF